MKMRVPMKEPLGTLDLRDGGEPGQDDTVEEHVIDAVVNIVGVFMTIAIGREMIPRHKQATDAEVENQQSTPVTLGRYEKGESKIVSRLPHRQIAGSSLETQFVTYSTNGP